MNGTFADRVLEAASRKGAAVCVGLDPVLGKLPAAVRGAGADAGATDTADTAEPPGTAETPDTTDTPDASASGSGVGGVGGRGGKGGGGGACDAEEALAAVERFCVGVLEAVAGAVPCVKPQLACFERYGSGGVAVYERVVDHAKRLGLLVIADAKRGDIGISAAHYAEALLAGGHAADAVTVNPYLGPDTLEPFVDTAASHDAGVFVLVRTSNPGSDALQSREIVDGRTVAEAVADTVTQLGAAHAGSHGYSHVGAVVGATKPADAAALRARMPHALFLVPGFGAQGGSAQDVRACFKPDGTGAVITASRSVIYAPPRVGEAWDGAVRRAAEALRDQVASLSG